MADKRKKVIKEWSKIEKDYFTCNFHAWPMLGAIYQSYCLQCKNDFFKSRGVK